VAKAAGKEVAKAKPFVTKFGLNHITHLVEEKKAKLVVIASDVDPVELVLWLPALCRKMGVPYVIVNNKGEMKGSAVAGPVAKECADLWPRVASNSGSIL
jgi:large subunit ribosomal protein L7Ae